MVGRSGKSPTASSIFLAAGMIMGVLNVTPDSFSDGGEFLSTEKAARAADQMAAKARRLSMLAANRRGPAPNPFSAEEELRRVVPVIEKLRAKIDIFISIDTSKAEVAGAAMDAGASIINDVTGGRGDDGNDVAGRKRNAGIHHHAHAGQSADDADRAAL